MVDGWKIHTIGDLFEIKAGGDLQKQYYSAVPTDIFKYQIFANSLENKGLYGYTSQPRFDGDAVTITGRGDIGHAEYRPDRFDAIVRLLVLMPKVDIDCKYITYYINSLVHFPKENTGVPQLTAPKVKRIKINLPETKLEQTAIANILSKVDEAIASVQKSISAAERLKKSLMQNLLTGRMKPDGTLRKDDEFYVDEKFGKVPKGWEVKAIGDKSFCTINPSYKYKKKEVYDFVPMDAVRERFGGLDYIEKQIIDNGSYTRFKTGDILFAKITPCSENGKVAYIEHIESEIGFASTEFIVFHPTEQVDGRFVYMMLVSENVHRLAISLMEGTTGRQRIPWKIFQNRIFVAMPNKKEQAEIVQLLISFDKQIIDKQINITILDQLKKSLMQNLLTGKVRVRL